MAKASINPRHQCHLCDKLGVLYFDYKLWCTSCGSGPLSEYSKTINREKQEELSEEQLNNLF